VQIVRFFAKRSSNTVHVSNCKGQLHSCCH